MASTWGDDQRWARLFWVHGGHLKAVKLKEQGIEDKDAESLAGYLSRSCFPESRAQLKLAPRTPLWLAELNLGNNKLTDVGVKCISRVLLDHHVSLGKLWLHQNLIGSVGAESVAEFIQNSVCPVEEVHLSHNWIGWEAFPTLFGAIAHQWRYPIKGRRDPKPLWLRLEQQKCPKWKDEPLTKEMLTEADFQMRSIRKSFMRKPPDYNIGPMICVVGWIAGGCNATKCLHRHEHGPVVHLPYVFNQSEIKTGSSLAYPVGLIAPRQDRRPTSMASRETQLDRSAADDQLLITELASFLLDEGPTEMHAAPDEVWPSWESVQKELEEINASTGSEECCSSSEAVVPSTCREEDYSRTGWIDPAPTQEECLDMDSEAALVMQRLVEYLKQAKDVESAKRVISHPKSSIDPAVARAAILRFDGAQIHTEEFP